MNNRFERGEETNVRVGQRGIPNTRVVDPTSPGHRRKLLAAARRGHHGGSDA